MFVSSLGTRQAGKPVRPTGRPSCASSTPTSTPTTSTTPIVPFFLISVFEGQRPVPADDRRRAHQGECPAIRPVGSAEQRVGGLRRKTASQSSCRAWRSVVPTTAANASTCRRSPPTFISRMYSRKSSASSTSCLAPERRQAPDAALSGYVLGPLLGSAPGRQGRAIPDQVREIGASFNTVLAYRDPTQQIVYDNYMTVRKHLEFLKSLDRRPARRHRLRQDAEPEKTFAWYWLKNGEDSEYFNHKDVVFECFHNFVAFSQWGNSSTTSWRNWVATAVMPRRQGLVHQDDGGRLRQAGGAAFPPLERFVMELFRTISPNGGQHLRPGGNAAARVRAARLHR